MSISVRLVVVCLFLTGTVMADQGRGGGPPTAGVPPAQGTGPAQPQAIEGAPTAVISGVVVEGGTGQPVGGAIVSMSVSGRNIPVGTQTRQLTDDKGRFAFVNVWGDNAYLLSASKFGYLDGGVGREKSPADPIRPVLVEGSVAERRASHDLAAGRHLWFRARRNR